MLFSVYAVSPLERGLTTLLSDYSPIQHLVCHLDTPNQISAQAILDQMKVMEEVDVSARLEVADYSLSSYLGRYHLLEEKVVEVSQEQYEVDQLMKLPLYPIYHYP